MRKAPHRDFVSVVRSSAQDIYQQLIDGRSDLTPEQGLILVQDSDFRAEELAETWRELRELRAQVALIGLLNGNPLDSVRSLDLARRVEFADHLRDLADSIEQNGGDQ